MNITMFAANTAARLPLVVIDERESFGDWNPDTETTTADDTFLEYGRRGRRGRHSSCTPQFLEESAKEIVVKAQTVFQIKSLQNCIYL